MKNIVFMGTSSFAAFILEKIVSQPGVNVSYVYTRPPKPAGRGQQIKKSPAHETAERLGIEVRAPASLKNETPPSDMDLVLIVSYGLIVPDSFIEASRCGCVNIHTSLLPALRGPSPIQSAIFEGHKKTGVTIMFISPELDAGDIVEQYCVDIEDNEDFVTLEQKLLNLSIANISAAINNIFSGSFVRTPQNHELATYTKKITSADLLIDWFGNCIDIIRQIRAFTPDCYFYHNENYIKIISADYSIMHHDRIPGVVEVSKSCMSIYCKDGVILPRILQRSGKKALPLDVFLLGYRALR